MSSKFVLTTAVQISAPSNLNDVASQIRNKLQNITATVKIKFDASTITSLTTTNAKLKDINSTLKSISSSSRSASAGMSQLANVLKAAGAGANSVAQGTRTVSTNLTKISNAANVSAHSMEGFGRQAGLALRRFAAYTTATAGFLLFLGAVKRGIGDAIEFQGQIIKLAQITGGSTASVQRLSRTVTKLAVDLGVSSKSLIQISNTLSQAGLKVDEVEHAVSALAKTTLAPTFDSITDSTETAIAVMAQFGTKAKDLEKVFGSINAVAAAFAVEAGDITTAIQKSGGVFKTAGGDLNELIALFTSVRQTTRQSADIIASGFNTIFARIQRPKTIDSLKQLGVDLTDLSGKFVGPIEAVKRLNEAFGGLGQGNIQFAQIAEQLGGYRQIKVVLPLLQQYTVAQNALAVAKAGDNSLTNDAIKAQEQFAVKLSRVREEFSAFIRELVISDPFKLLIDGAATLSHALIEVLRVAKPLIPVIAALGTFKVATSAFGFARGFVPAASGQIGIRQIARANGGVVPGSGDSDSVKAMLTPGEFVIRKSSAQAIGYNKLRQLNAYAMGGQVQAYKYGDVVDYDYDDESDSRKQRGRDRRERNRNYRNRDVARHEARLNQVVGGEEQIKGPLRLLPRERLLPGTPYNGINQLGETQEQTKQRLRENRGLFGRNYVTNEEEHITLSQYRQKQRDEEDHYSLYRNSVNTSLVNASPHTPEIKTPYLSGFAAFKSRISRRIQNGTVGQDFGPINLLNQQNASLKNHPTLLAAQAEEQELKNQKIRDSFGISSSPPSNPPNNDGLKGLFGEHGQPQSRFRKFTKGRIGQGLKNYGASAVGIASALGGQALVGDSEDKLNQGDSSGHAEGRFVGGRTLQGFGTGAAIGFSVGGPLGAAAGAIIGGAYSFASASKEAAKALENAHFEKVAEGLKSFFGNIPGTGSVGFLSENLRKVDRRVSSTSGEEGRIAQGVLSKTLQDLNTFNSGLVNTSHDFNDFKSKGGLVSLQFIAEHTGRSLEEMQKEVNDTINGLQSSKQYLKDQEAAQAKLTEQIKFAQGLGGALKDAADAADYLGDRFDHAFSTLGGGGPSKFSGVAGLQNAFSGHEAISNIGQFSNAATQAGGLLGNNIGGGVAQDAIAIAKFTQELPNALREFASSRQQGDEKTIGEDIAHFLRGRFGDNKNIPGFDRVVSAAQGQTVGEAGGEKFTQHISENANKVAEDIIKDTALNFSRELLEKFVKEYTNQINHFTRRLNSVYGIELKARQQNSNNIKNRFDRQNTLNSFQLHDEGPSLQSFDKNRLAQQAALLGPNGGLAGNVPGLLGEIANKRGQIRTANDTLQNNPSEAAAESLESLKAELESLEKALEHATDINERASLIQDKLSKATASRQQVNAAAQGFVFAGDADRLKINRESAAAIIAARGGLAGLTGQQREEASAGLDRFSNVRTRAFGTKIVDGKEIGLTGQEAKEKATVAELRRQGLADAEIAGGSGLSEQEKALISELKTTFDGEARNRELATKALSNLPKELKQELSDVFNKFINDMRRNVLGEEGRNLGNNLTGANLSRKGIQDNLNNFDTLDALTGGSARTGNNTANAQALKLATEKRRLSTLGSIAASSQQIAGNDRHTLEISPGANNEAFLNRLGISAPSITKGRRELDSEQIGTFAQEATKRFQKLTGNTDINLSNGAKEAALNSGALGERSTIQIVKALQTFFKSTANEAQKDFQEGSVTFAADFKSQSAELKSLVDTLVGLDKIPFDQVTKLINGLSNLKLSTLNEELKNINSQIDALHVDIKDNRTKVEAIHESSGGSIFSSRGTDTVPAMLTPGEFVVNKAATARHRGLLEQINSGRAKGYATGGEVDDYKEREAMAERYATRAALSVRNQLADAEDLTVGSRLNLEATGRGNAAHAVRERLAAREAAKAASESPKPTTYSSIVGPNISYGQAFKGNAGHQNSQPSGDTSELKEDSPVFGPREATKRERYVAAQKEIQDNRRAQVTARARANAESRGRVFGIDTTSKRAIGMQERAAKEKVHTDRRRNNRRTLALERGKKILEDMSIGIDAHSDGKGDIRDYTEQEILRVGLGLVSADSDENQRFGTGTINGKSIERKTGNNPDDFYTRLHRARGISFLHKPSNPADFNERVKRAKGNSRPTNTAAFKIQLAEYRRAHGYSMGGGVDNIPSYLSQGEYVINRGAADAIGKPALDKLNSARRFANGGSVGGTATQNGNGALGSLISNEARQAMTALSANLVTFAQIGNTLAKALEAFPRQVEITGQHKVEVIINGAEALHGLQPMLEDLIQSKVSQVLSNFQKKTIPEASAHAPG